MAFEQLATELETAFCRLLRHELDDYAFVMEGDVVLNVPSEALIGRLEADWDQLPDYHCEAHGAGKLVGTIGIHIVAGEFNMVHRDLVDGELRSPMLKAMGCADYPPFCR